MFKEFEQQIQIKNESITVKVSIKVEEDSDGDVSGDVSWSPEEEAAYIARFESGELFRAWILVKATTLGEEGFDSLGACHIHTGKLFENDVNETVNDHDMVKNAIADLITRLISKAKLLRSLA